VPRGDADVEVEAVFVLHEKADPAVIVREANRQLAAHQRIRRGTVWPEQDFPRTPTMKVKRADVAHYFEAQGESTAAGSKE